MRNGGSLRGHLTQHLVQQETMPNLQATNDFQAMDDESPWRSGEKAPTAGVSNAKQRRLYGASFIWYHMARGDRLRAENPTAAPEEDDPACMYQQMQDDDEEPSAPDGLQHSGMQQYPDGYHVLRSTTSPPALVGAPSSPKGGVRVSTPLAGLAPGAVGSNQECYQAMND